MDVGQSCALASSDHPWQIKLRAQSITGLLFNNTKGRFKYCFQNCMHMRGGARMKKSQATKTSPMPSLLPEEDRLSWMSRLSRIIVILTPASMDVWVAIILWMIWGICLLSFRARREITFKLLSLKTLIHCIWYFAPIAAIFFLYNMEIMQDAKRLSKEALAEKNLIDQLSQYTMFSFGSLFVFYPFLIASGLPNISELALATDLRFPKYGKRILLCSVFHLATHALCRSNLANQKIKASFFFYRCV